MKGKQKYIFTHAFNRGELYHETNIVNIKQVK